MPYLGALLSARRGRAWIIQPEEHRAIFEAVRGPSEPTATLSEVLVGLAAVSPPLVLEELRLLDEQALQRLQARLRLWPCPRGI